jgi:hypothetical protein
MFTEKDLQQFKNKCIALEKVNEQIENFKKGFPFINLFAAATKKYGIKVLSKEEIENYLNAYDVFMADKKIIKFVPASGAASRMFKHLFEFLDVYQPDEKGLRLYNSDIGFNSVYHFINNLDKLAFYDDLKATMANAGLELEEELLKKNFHTILEYLLHDKGLGYAKLPKGLLKFHQYNDANRFAVEEHLVEAAVYGKNKDGNAYIHFTVSPEHQQKFEETIDQFKTWYEKKYGVNFQISFSKQKPSTDTIAVTPENKPFREDDGSILFRPGGHGALIENLNEMDADIIFVKNIDNIVPDRLKEETFTYKKLIGSYLAAIQEDVFTFLYTLEEGNPSEEDLQDMFIFLNNKLSIEVPAYIKLLDKMEQVDWLYEQLNRPIRVCGMVKNEGEPGGGPFIVKGIDGNKSLQIVESSQIDFSKEGQEKIVNNATHFNPVDLVCAVRDFKGNKFNLKDFIDNNTGFISNKSKNGRDLKAQELPGLWNGAMANWITVFVEVPIITFNPVKTVNDLLREQHQ